VEIEGSIFVYLIMLLLLYSLGVTPGLHPASFGMRVCQHILACMCALS